MSVPKIIHQLWIGEKPLPINALNSIKNMNSEFEYMFWCEKTIEEKLKIHPRYQRKIDEHEAIWGKADMYRYLILEQYGGVFVDADMVAIEPFDEFLLNKAFFCWEHETERKNLCATSLQAYPKNHIIPQTAIKWILDNQVNERKAKTPSWELVGPGLLTRVYHTLIGDKDCVNVFPSYYALPDHHTGTKYTGHGKVYMTHEWGSTRNNYNNINTMKIPPHHTQPNNSIDIHIPNTTINKQLKEVMKGIKEMTGHYNINIHYDKDLSKYLKSMRFVRHKVSNNIQCEIKELEYYNEKNQIINHKNIEDTEQRLSEKYIEENDIVLELGARYGTVSCLVNRIIKDKQNHYVVEPDNTVWEALEKNMKHNNCKFNILKGVIGKKKYKLEGSGYAKHSVEDTSYGKTVIETFDIPDVPFNTLIADCEGFLETFYDENKYFFEKINKIIMECDMPEKCDYQRLLDEWTKLGFKVHDHTIEYGLNFFVLKK